MLVHTAKHRLSTSPAKILFSFPPYTGGLTIFPAPQPTIPFNPRYYVDQPPYYTSQLRCALCTILLARYPGAVPSNFPFYPQPFYFNFLLSTICIWMESSPEKLWQTVLLKEGRHLAFQFFS